MRMRQILVGLLLFSLLFANIVLAQQQTLDILSPITAFLTNRDVVAILFVFLFVFFLLLIGGAIPKLSSGFPLGLIAFLILIALAFILPQFVTFPDYMKVVPDSFKYWKLPDAAIEALQLIALPAEWGYVPAIIYLFILPFAAIYTLVWAFLQLLNIFPQSQVNKMLALIITFLTIPMGAFVKMVWVLFGFMGGWSVAIFAITFIVGILFRGGAIATKEISEYRKYADKYKMETDIIREALRDALRKNDPGLMRQTAGTYIQRLGVMGKDKAAKLLFQASSEETPNDQVAQYINQAIKRL